MKTSKKIRVLVVDDSAFMRKAISMMIGDDPAIEVVGTANNGAEGVEKVHELLPDLVTMDIEMPRMDGLTALRKIMQERPTPVMMVSSLTSEGAQATFDALELGAVDFIPKELSYVSLDIVKIKKDLVEKIKQIHKRRSLLMAKFRRQRISQIARGTTPAEAKRTASARPKIIPPKPSIARLPKKLLRIAAIGTSTGGPPALQAVIPHLPKNFPVPVLVVQHMPPTFTKSLARRLDGLSLLQVKEAEPGETIQRGVVYIAPGDRHMTVSKRGAQSCITLSREPEDTLYKPSVDIMMNSIVDQFRGNTLAIIMTGMGKDGVEGLKKVKASGGIIIAQDEETCVVYGMPRAAVDAGITDAISPVERIAADMVSCF